MSEIQPGRKVGLDFCCGGYVICRNCVSGSVTQENIVKYNGFVL